ncbi:MAG: hypothetical protein NZ772_01250 [Cyanobacteria bacterium]|nr:hypothetical protein [Cyanobacteriota bacterium]MDW8200081.1 hypothetical protein [Cyanobacteriota bacterium SKYGB_h_bin112]
MITHLLDIRRLSKPQDSVPAYFVMSTAPVNVEDLSEPPKGEFAEPIANPDEAVKEIACHLANHLKSHNSDEQFAEVVVVVHGYNTKATGEFGAEGWYHNIYKHINTEPSLKQLKGAVLLGYRWPSEQFKGDESGSFAQKRRWSIESLPIVLDKILDLGWICFLLGVASIVAMTVLSAMRSVYSQTALILALALLGLAAVMTLPILTILLLRMSAYFRDAYRASNYGVPDLVELIRSLDKAVFDNMTSAKGEHGREQVTSFFDDNRHRIRLSFIGHSMGGFVVTNTVRILSDVFDDRSIGNLALNASEKHPSPDIGNVFTLGRLILASPDISLETILAGRANFLQSSLRRFQEAYLFSNDGDIVLRLASTAANYFSFPSRTRDSGYRLGNVAIKNRPADYFENIQTSKTRFLDRRPTKYGIVNQRLDGSFDLDGATVFKYLFVTRWGQKIDDLNKARRAMADQETNATPLASLFTYFDCTDYIDYTNYKGCEGTEMSVVSFAKEKLALSIWDYVQLTIAYFIGFESWVTKTPWLRRLFLYRDVHGGYFNGEFSSRAIYGIAFLGFKGFLQSLNPEVSLATVEQRLQALGRFADCCSQKQIQVWLSPKRYQTDILGQDVLLPTHLGSESRTGTIRDE